MTFLNLTSDVIDYRSGAIYRSCNTSNGVPVYGKCTLGVVSDISEWVEGTYQRCRCYCKSGATEATAPDCCPFPGLLYPFLGSPAIDIMRSLL
jgi:hypothetical protein